MLPMELLLFLVTALTHFRTARGITKALEKGGPPNPGAGSNTEHGLDVIHR